MCLLVTLFAAVIASICWFLVDPKHNLQLGTLSLMFWGAGLMWFADCMATYLGGEPFLDTSLDDLILGAVVVLCGLILWLAIVLVKNPKRIFTY